MGSRPSGTVTFLFTDVQGSTELWADHPTAMAQALGRHDEIVLDAIRRGGGVVFSTGGDGFGSAFSRAGAAAAAAVEAQRYLTAEVWPTPVVINVRMGLHTGVAQERAGNYFGSPVNRAARVMSVGHGGQIVCSATTERLLSEEVGL